MGEEKRTVLVEFVNYRAAGDPTFIGRVCKLPKGYKGTLKVEDLGKVKRRLMFVSLLGLRVCGRRILFQGGPGSRSVNFAVAIESVHPNQNQHQN